MHITRDLIKTFSLTEAPKKTSKRFPPRSAWRRLTYARSQRILRATRFKRSTAQSSAKQTNCAAPILRLTRMSVRSWERRVCEFGNKKKYSYVCLTWLLCFCDLAAGFKWRTSAHAQISRMKSNARHVPSKTIGRSRSALLTATCTRISARWSSKRAASVWYRSPCRTVRKRNSAMSIAMHCTVSNQATSVAVITNYTNRNVICERRIVENMFSLCQLRGVWPLLPSKDAPGYAPRTTSPCADLTIKLIQTNAFCPLKVADRETL